MDGLVPWGLLILAILILDIALRRAVRWWRWRPVKDLPEGLPYHVYTTEYDQVVSAKGLSTRLPSLSPDDANGFVASDRTTWDAGIANADEMFRGLAEFDGSERLSDLVDVDTAVTLLVDHSGSMRGEPITFTAAAIRKLVEILKERGCKTEVIGFTTAGWHGGFARRKWLASGRPPRPGRLCALLHVIYKSFDDAELSEDSLREMLNPDVLRENVDGEAIEFAERRLSVRPEDSKILVVISDGAPVDDSTLRHNGPSFLHRHVKDVIGRIELTRDIAVCAVGINHNVSEYYHYARLARDGKSLVTGVLNLLGNMDARPDSP